jgi:hypothetical protein
MKMIIVLLSALLLANGTRAQAGSFKEIAGKWDIVGKEKASLTIVDSATIELVYGGERRVIQGYHIDFSKTPHWFDFSASDSSSSFKVKSLVQKVGDDVLKWQLFIDEERAPHFVSGKGEVFYLKKARPTSASLAAQ